MVASVFTDRTSIYNHRRPHLAVTSPHRHSAGRTLRVRVFDFTQSAHLTVVHNLKMDSTSSPCARSSHVSWLLLSTGCTHHRSALMHTIALTHLALAVRVSSASSPTRTAQGVRDSGAHRLASCAKSRHCRSGLLSRLSAIALCPIFFDSLVPPLSQIRAPCNR